MQLDPEMGTPAASGDAAGEGANPQPERTLPESDAAEPIQSEAPRIGLVGCLTDIPAVAAYLRRIGAEPVNLCRARVVDQEHGYPRETGRIKFAADGGITVSGTADRPSKDEADAITTAFKGVQFPKQETLTAISTPPPGCDPDDINSFVCHDFRGRIVMIHQRIDVADGTKIFKSWTRWSDGKWRNMEPEVLPFFGLPGAKDCSTLYIHEGAKAAKRVKRIISGDLQNSAFPWLDDMRHGAHIGWLGGVFGLERSDWESLAKMNWSRVVIIADNDAKGKAIVPSIAKKFSCEVRALIFTDQWPPRYDLGDECPPHLLTAPIAPLLRPATWATVEHPPEEGQRRPTYSLASQFRSEWAYTVAPRFFFHREAPGRGLNEDEFNAFVAPYSQLKNTAAKLLACAEAQLHSLDYNPGCKPGEMAGEMERRWNTFEPSPVKPIKGDPTPFLDFMAHLIPDDGERHQALRWIATLIARPDVRMRYSMLLISKRQGVGKSSVGNMLGPLVGMSNVSIVNEQALVGSQFNGWASGKRLVIVNEIYTAQKRAAYDSLKEILTEDFITCNEKHVKPYRMPNWIVFIACSNSDEALYLDDEDRRWFVPSLTDRLQPTAYWDALYGWLAADGLGIVAGWAKDFVLTDHVRTGDRAPPSMAKAAIVEASRSEGKTLAREVAEWLRERGEPTILLARDVRSWIAAKRGMDIAHRHLEKPRTIIAEMLAVDGLYSLTGDKRPRTKSGKEAVVMNFDPAECGPWSTIEGRLAMMADVGFNEIF